MGSVMTASISRRNFLWQTVSTIALTVSYTGRAAANDAVPCKPKSDNPAALAELVKSTPIIDIHCHIFNATDIPAYQFLKSVVSLKAFSDAYLAEADKGSIYQLKNGEWEAFYRESENEFDDIMELVREHEFLDNSYPLDRLLLTPGYHQEAALLRQLAASDPVASDNMEKRLIRAVLKRHDDGDNSAYARNWFRYSGIVDWPGPRKVTEAQIDTVAQRMRTQNARLRAGYHALRGVKRFIGCIVRSRVENFLDLRRTYAIHGVAIESPVKLFTPALVDFDYWLAGPSLRPAARRSAPSLIESKDASEHSRLNERTSVKRPRTTLMEQVELMGGLSKLFPAECHGYFPFCPWRQVDLTETGAPKKDTPLEILKTAITDHGFIGVKLYPAMGFRPRNNHLVSQHPSIEHPMFPIHLYDRDRFPYLPERKRGQSEQDWRFEAGKKFGRLLDDALSALYQYCVDHNVPIMAHAGPSNFAGGYDIYDGTLKHNFFSEKGAIIYWHKLIADPALKFASLRLNLAHSGFGNEYWEEQLIAALREDNNIYADVSYFEKILGGKSGDACRNAEEDGAKLHGAFNAHPNIAKKFMYGSDWYMMTQEDHSENYLNVIAKVLHNKVKDAPTFKAVMAGNASRFLGLTLKENSNYERLTAFYDRTFGPHSSKAREARTKLDRLADIGLETA